MKEDSTVYMVLAADAYFGISVAIFGACHIFH